MSDDKSRDEKGIAFQILLVDSYFLSQCCLKDHGHSTHVLSQVQGRFSVATSSLSATQHGKQSMKYSAGFSL